MEDWSEGSDEHGQDEIFPGEKNLLFFGKDSAKRSQSLWVIVGVSVCLDEDKYVLAKGTREGGCGGSCQGRAETMEPLRVPHGQDHPLLWQSSAPLHSPRQGVRQATREDQAGADACQGL